MKKISASNAVMQAVEEACALYGVRCYRMQSRAITVVGAGGKERPMFMGAWRDENGTPHKKGMADLLLTPRVANATYGHSEFEGNLIRRYMLPNPMAVPLWVECKSGTGDLSKEQQLFAEDVLKAGAFFLVARDSAQVVIDWFEKYGVKR